MSVSPTAAVIKGGAKKTTAKKVVTKLVTKTAGVDLIAKTAKEVENLTKAQALKMVPELEDSSSFNDFKQGGVLSVIQDKGWWEGSDTFRTYLKNVLGVDPGKAYALIRTYNSLIESEVPWDKVKGVRWTKLDVIAGVINEENVDEWVQRAKDLSTLQLRDFVIEWSKAKAKEDAPEGSGAAEVATSNVTTLTYKVHEDQKETIKNAVIKAKEENNTRVDAVALELITLQYLEGTLGKQKKQKSLGAQIKTAGFKKAITELASVYPEEWATEYGPDASLVEEGITVADFLENTGYEAIMEEVPKVFPEESAASESGSEAPLMDALKTAGVEDALEAFEQAFPEVNLTAEM